MNFIPQFEPEPETISDEEEIIVEPVNNITTTLTEDDIFAKPPPKMKALKEPVKKKRTISEAHKKALGDAREKALATRKRNAAIRKEEKELLKKKKEQELEQLREDVNGITKKKDQPLPVVEEPIKEQVIEEEIKEVVKPVIPSESIKQVQFDNKQIEEISLNAIIQYDKIRKTRKQEKLEQHKLDEHENKIKQELQRKLQPTNQINNYWDNCY
tara:strand:- start:218 stop:859 length:642 start_codon:yes stop_codon:yes gene_type:complete